jgi:hypothetical protein
VRGIADDEKMKSEAVDWLILLGVLLPLSLTTYQRNGLWNNELELWQDNIRKSPRKERPRAHLGFLHKELKDYSLALIHFKEALTYPDMPAADEVREAMAFIEAAQKEQKKGKK